MPESAPPLSGSRLWPPATLPLLLMVAVPFLLPHHRQPIPTFFQEWWSVVLGLGFAGILTRAAYREALALPNVALLPVAIAGLVLVQLATGAGLRAHAAFLALLFLGWAVLLMAVTRSVARRHGEAALARSLAWGIVIAALASAALVALQFTGGLRTTGWVSLPISNRLFANLNQPNHLALLLWLGVASILYLRRRADIGLSVALLAVGACAAASVLSGSRAVVAYSALLLPLAAWWDRRMPTRCSSLPVVLAASGAALLTHIVLSTLAEPADAVTLAQREWGKDSHAVRTGLWWAAWQMGLDHPLLGIGWGEFAAATFRDLPRLAEAAPPGLPVTPAEHAHNVFLQLFAELGFAAPLALAGFGFAWVRGVLRAAPGEEGLFALALVLLLGLHAQVEYTLWYAFFLGIAAVALALGDRSRLPVPKPGRLAVASVLLASFAVAALLRHDYARLEDTMRWPVTDDGAKPRPWADVSAELVALRQHSRFGPYVDLVLAGVMTLDRENLPHKLAVCRSAIAFSPTDYAVFKCAGLLALDGQREAALDRLERAMLAYPERVAGFVADATARQPIHPELGPLVDSARRFATERKLMPAS